MDTAYAGMTVRDVDGVCQNQDLQDYGDLQDWDDATHRFMDCGLSLQ